MKAVIMIFVIFVITGMSLFSVTYYSRGSSPTYYVNGLTSWRSNRDGTGTSPSSFSVNNLLLVVQNNHSMTATATWDVSGSGSRVEVENGGKITTGPFNHRITGKVYNGGTYEVNHTTYDDLGWGGGGELEPNSNFILNNTSINFNDRVSYGNLIVQAGIAQCDASTAGLEIKGNLVIKNSAKFIYDVSTISNPAIPIGSITVEGGGSFIGGTGSPSIVYNVSGNVNVNNDAYFYGSTGGGSSTFNIGGDVNIAASSHFYAVYRDSGDLPYGYWNVAGSFYDYGSYNAVNRNAVGYPTITLSGTGKFVRFGDLSGLQARHMIEFANNSSYTMLSDLPFFNWMQFRVRGTLNAQTFQVRALGANTTFGIWGTFRTARIQGFSGASNTAISTDNSPALTLQTGCTIEYTANSTQTFSPRTDYKNVILSGSGTKTISGNVTIANTFTVGSPLTLSANLTCNGLVAVNQPITIGSSYNLILYGTMSGESSIIGGTIQILGGSAVPTLNLVTANVSSIFLNRNNGCTITGNTVRTGVLNLVNGTFGIGSKSLEITGNLSGGTNLTATFSSTLIISGSADNFDVPSQITALHTFQLNRTNGADLQNNLTLTNLTLTNGTLAVGSHTLSISGQIGTTSGVLGTTGDSTVHFTPGSVNSDLPPITVGTLIINRPGGVISQAGSITAGILNLATGTLAINNHPLYITGQILANGGSLSGGSNASLSLTRSVTSATIPAVSLSTYSQNCSITVNLAGSVSVGWITLGDGILNLDSHSLLVTRGFTPGFITPNLGSITGGVSSSLILNADNFEAWDLPTTTVGNLSVHLTRGCRMNGDVMVQTSVNLYDGVVNPKGKLTINNGVTINRFAGSFSESPHLGDGLQLNYWQTARTGYELPPQAGKIHSINVYGHVRVIATNDVYVQNSLVVDQGSMFDLGEYHLYLGENGIISGDGDLFGAASKDIGSGGMDGSPAGFKIMAGTQIDDFAFNQQPVSQDYQGAGSILRTWSFSGSIDGSAQLTLLWRSFADNGIIWSPENRAVVFRRTGGRWYPVGDPQDVSAMGEERHVIVVTDAFSDWTVFPEDRPLPVVLSSFTAAVTAGNVVRINWTTQSESELTGYYVLRATSLSIADAISVSPLITAHNTASEQSYTYSDNELANHLTYYYWLECVEMGGIVNHFGPVSVYVDFGGDDPGTPVPPSENRLLSAYPNPFNPVTFIPYQIKDAGNVTITIFNQRGQVVRMMRQDHPTPGFYRIAWDATDGNGYALPSGIYFYRMDFGKYHAIHKVLLMK